MFRDHPKLDKTKRCRTLTSVHVCYCHFQEGRLKEIFATKIFPNHRIRWTGRDTQRSSKSNSCACWKLAFLLPGSFLPPTLPFPWAISSDNSTWVLKEVFQLGGGVGWKKTLSSFIFLTKSEYFLKRGKKKPKTKPTSKNINKSILSANPLVGVGLKRSWVTHSWAALCRGWKLVLSRFSGIF